MNSGDRFTLQAYVDHELDEAATRAFEARLFTDPELMATVRALRAQNQLLRDAFRTPAAAPSPPVPQAPARARWHGPAAVAATWVFALALGFAGGHLFDRDGSNPDALRVSTLQQALETVRSGDTVAWRDPRSRREGSVQPVVTYRNSGGKYCREFEEVRHVDGSTTVEGGIACREDDGRWRVRIRYFL